ncbi:MAG: hypothetical protein N3D10_00905 [Candidatus Micrarchaeota archaeon]|nr:hypothetical protein [Candidatus Micrarchaeota archaeon]
MKIIGNCFLLRPINTEQKPLLLKKEENSAQNTAAQKNNKEEFNKFFNRDRKMPDAPGGIGF